MYTSFPFGAVLGAMGYRNRIVNPRSAIDQRNVGASLTPGADSQYCLDHWRARMSQASKFSVQRKQDNTFYNYGVSYHTLITSLAATALGVNDFFAYEQPVEGYLTSDFGWGGSNPRPAMVEWLVQSSVPGLLSGYIYNTLVAETAVWQAPILANTPTKISAPILHNGNNLLDQGLNPSIFVGIGLGAGANVTAPATTGWSAGQKWSTPGDMGFITNAGATLRIGAVQVKPLPYVTPFDLIDPATEMELCQRYFEKTYDLVTAPGAVADFNGALIAECADAPTGVLMQYRFATSKRTNPNVSVYSTQTGAVGKLYDQTGGVDVSALVVRIGFSGCVLANAGAGTVGHTYNAHATANAEF